MSVIDEAFGSLRSQVLEPTLDRVKDYFGGIQGTATFGGGSPPRVDISFGERRVLSIWALAAALVVGVVVTLVISRGR